MSYLRSQPSPDNVQTTPIKAPIPQTQQAAQQSQTPQSSGAPQQPKSVSMPIVAIPVNCPPGLEYLLVVDQLLIKQIVEILEVFTTFETNNSRAFEMSIYSVTKQEQYVNRAVACTPRPDLNKLTCLPHRGHVRQYSSQNSWTLLAKDSDRNVGKISKKWSGLLREHFTDADVFGVNFPGDQDVRAKALLMAATFLIDFMFFEKKGNRERDRPGMMH
ncbi:unnamed protein product [Oppiella nova]|uniref:Phospholipid scramblase n=1 Tax=Oppiella nova TaxID=334625 RepID=A0A7R9LCV6_9ACAR|nr:unnamed protein product [Oppiella nova]CAG2162276.1 unnamed protein product [Oppiella nova]